MKKTAEREYVTVRPENRAGSPTYVVTWYPQDADGKSRRARLRFSDSKKAERKADEIETWMRRSQDPMTPETIKEAQTAFMLRDQLFPGMSLPKIIQEHSKRGQTIMPTILVKQAGLAFIETRSNPNNYAERTRKTIRNHINRFNEQFGFRLLSSISAEDIETYLREAVGGCGKTQNQHLITIRSFFRWARLKKQWLDYAKPSAAELVDSPKVSRAEHEVYSPEEFTRILACTPTSLLTFMLLGQFAGIRSEERLRMKWGHWRTDEDNKFVLNEDVTKTNRRRRVDVQPNLAEWLLPLRSHPDDLIVPYRNPFQQTGKILRAAGVKSKQNALRAGFASYHLELFDNPALTAKNDGHSPNELETSYKSISGVTKKTAREMFDITPDRVIDYARAHGFPTPEWANKYLVAA
jgi:integrase